MAQPPFSQGFPGGTVAVQWALLCYYGGLWNEALKQCCPRKLPAVRERSCNCAQFDGVLSWCNRGTNFKFDLVLINSDSQWNSPMWLAVTMLGSTWKKWSTNGISELQLLSILSCPKHLISHWLRPISRGDEWYCSVQRGALEKWKVYVLPKRARGEMKSRVPGTHLSPKVLVGAVEGIWK